MSYPGDSIALADVPRTSDVDRLARERRRPVTLTRDGQPSSVVLTVENFEALTYTESIRAAIAEGLAEADAGLGMSTAELKRRLESKYGPLPKV